MTQHTQPITAESIFYKLFEPQPMIVEGLISKGLTILGGSPKIGKSWLALDLAISVANGSPFLGKSVQKTGLAEQKTMLRMMSRAVTTVTPVTAPPPVGRYRHCRHSCH